MSACEFPITEGTERAWQENSHQALVEGYTDFHGRFVDRDIAAYIFSYQLPEQMETEEALDILSKQVIQAVDGYKMVSRTQTELALRRPVTYYMQGGFDEYRFLVDDSGQVTVMFSNIDSPAELSDYRRKLLKKLYSIHSGRRE